MASDPTSVLQGQVAGNDAAVPGQKLSRRSRLELWLFVLPALVLQLAWGWYPLIVAFLLSFTDGRPRGPLSFTGLESYMRMVNDPLVAQTFRVTLIYSVLSIVLTFVIPIFVAILLMEMPQRVMRWMMLLWFLPLSSIANAVLWRYLYNPQYGLFQFIATSLGLPEQRFLNNSSQVLFWLIFPGILLFGPGLIYMASIQSIPASYYEAAEIEGAGFFRKIWTISLPRLRPIIAMMLLFAVIGTPQEFAWPTLMTGGGPGNASTTVVMYVYSLLRNLRYADATALAILLFLVLLIVVMIFRWFFKEDPDT
jgi:multiple sugar transport system permease protein